jgi:hypothetical protein
MRFLSIVFLLAVCLLIFASCDTGGGGVRTPAQGEPIAINGELWFEPLTKPFSGGLGDPCEVDSEYTELRAGMPVVVKDVAGSTVATGELEAGVIVDLTFAEHNGCRFDFRVEDVPVSAYYQIEVADTGAATFSYDELEAMNWTVRWGVGE